MIGIDFIDKGISTIKQTVAASFLRVEHIHYYSDKKICKVAYSHGRMGNFAKYE